VPDQPDQPAWLDDLGSPLYATGQLERALARAAESGDPADRERALVKAGRWREVLAGMAGGRIRPGSRTPVAGTPAWVTLEVAHGGFATGWYLAEAPLTGQEEARLSSLPADVPGHSGRERLNLPHRRRNGRDAGRLQPGGTDRPT